MANEYYWAYIITGMQLIGVIYSPDGRRSFLVQMEKYST